MKFLDLFRRKLQMSVSFYRILRRRLGSNLFVCSSLNNPNTDTRFISAKLVAFSLLILGPMSGFFWRYHNRTCFIVVSVSLSAHNTCMRLMYSGTANVVSNGGPLLSQVFSNESTDAFGRYVWSKLRCRLYSLCDSGWKYRTAWRLI